MPALHVNTRSHSSGALCCFARPFLPLSHLLSLSHSPSPSLRYSIKIKPRRAWKLTLVFTVSWGRAAGVRRGGAAREHGETKLELDVLVCVRGQTQKVNHLYVIYSCLFRWRAHCLISWPRHKSRNTQSPEPLGVEHIAHITSWLSLIRQRLQVIFEGRTDIKLYQGQTPKLWLEECF